MNRDIILAREAGISESHAQGMQGFLERFAALVAEHEREACAKVCEDAISSIWEFHPEYVSQVGKNVCTNLAAAIRARGQAEQAQPVAYFHVEHRTNACSEVCDAQEMKFKGNIL